MWSIIPALLACISCTTDTPQVKGKWQSLPVTDKRNQLLLNLEDMKIADTHGTVAEAFDQNHKVVPQLECMTNMSYFSTYKVDLSDAKCPLEDDSAQCANRQCAIEPLSRKDIDTCIFESQFLARLRKDSVHDAAPTYKNYVPESAVLYRNCTVDYCYPEDESDDSFGVWVDLIDNAERFTGYDGANARNMWGRLYAENVFGYNGDAPSSPPPAQPQPTGLGGLANLMKKSDPGMEVEPSSTKVPDGIVEQRLFYRLLSGMHASISTHLTYHWWNATSEQWEASLPDWLERVGWFQERINNIFFDYALVSRAIAKIANQYSDQLLFAPSDKSIDDTVRAAMTKLGKCISDSPFAYAIDETELFNFENADEVKAELRKRVKNVNALTSCVGCERCRLWSKIQTAGYGTALKILFELPENPEDDLEAVKHILGSFRRSELVALINTFGRISHSVMAAETFKNQVVDSVTDKSTFTYALKSELAHTKEALTFIFKSYLDSPKIVYRMFMRTCNYLWHRYVIGGPEVTYLDIKNHGDSGNDNAEKGEL